MPDDIIAKPRKKTEPSEKKPVEPPAQEVDTEEVEYASCADAVTELLNEVAQLAAPYLEAELIGMVTIVAVSADGNYSQSHEVSKIPESAGDDKAEEARIRRRNATSRMLTAMELLKHKTRLLDGLTDLIKKLHG